MTTNGSWSCGCSSWASSTTPPNETLWHGPQNGGSSLRLVIPVARDHFCMEPTEDCGMIAAAAGSRAADFSGADGVRTGPNLAFDHERLAEVRLLAGNYSDLH